MTTGWIEWTKGFLRLLRAAKHCLIQDALLFPGLEDSLCLLRSGYMRNKQLLASITWAFYARYIGAFVVCFSRHLCDGVSLQLASCGKKEHMESYIISYHLKHTLLGLFFWSILLPLSLFFCFDPPFASYTQSVPHSQPLHIVWCSWCFFSSNGNLTLLYFSLPCFGKAGKLWITWWIYSSDNVLITPWSSPWCFIIRKIVKYRTHSYGYSM